MKNIVLIGMPGAGKSTVGVLLAKTLGMTFIDTDLIIQEREKSLLQQIIHEKGLQKFLAIEKEAILSVDVQHAVIATGGSVVYKEEAMRHLKKQGSLVYLALDFDEIDKRIQNITTRGIAKQENQTLADIYHERIPLYERYADITIDCTAVSTAEKVVQKIVTHAV